MKTIIAAVCLVALAGIMLLMVIGPQAEADASLVVAFSELPEASEPPATGRAEAYRELYDLRMARIADLEEYAELCAFPMNHSELGFTPVFVDHNGTACAVGHLMRCSGATELVNTIQAENNFIKLHEVTDGPAVEWMLHSGLTKEECELIQPSYHGMNGWDDDEMPDVRVREAGTNQAAVLYIRNHLQSTALKLRKDTPGSLATALARLGGRHEMLVPTFLQASHATNARRGDWCGTSFPERNAGHTASEHGPFSLLLVRQFRNDAEEAILVRASVVFANGTIKPGQWREVGPGVTFTLDVDTLVLLESAAAATP